jgi:hypothetical protein
MMCNKQNALLGLRNRGKLLLLLLTLVSFSSTLYAREKDKEHYLLLGFNTDRSAFRDWATSPLWYKSGPLSLSLAYESMNANKDIETGVLYRFGIYRAKDATPVSSSKVKSLNLYHSRLYSFNKSNNKKLKLDLGGMAQLHGNYRLNLSLNNNALGLEAMTSFMASARIGYHWQRTSTTRKKLLFIPITLHPAQRSIRLRANVGLLNFPLRNGYIYTIQSGVLNTFNPVEGYTFMMGGNNLSSALEYTIARPGRNGYRFGYAWSAFRTSKKYDVFETFTHSFQFTLLFNTNRVSSYAQ